MIRRSPRVLVGLTTFLAAALILNACQRQLPSSSPVAHGQAAAGNPAVVHPTGTPLSHRDSLHLLSRASFGPTSADVAALQKEGVDAWLTSQLSPQPEPGLVDILGPYRASLASPYELLAKFRKGKRGKDQHLTAADLNIVDRDSFRTALRQLDRDGLAETHEMLELSRHILSRYQLREVMVDFWENHFNVHGPKGAEKLYTGDYIEKAIRPHALGRFEELLKATAKHPAMLTYLDQRRSRRNTPKGKHGLNENYARELLELHTVGVGAGYEQADVVGAARVLTGLTVTGASERPPHFVFLRQNHDRGTKRVLGSTYGPTAKGDSGESEVQALLTSLAHHPSTARRLAGKLCAKFVSDHPPATCVEEATEEYLKSGGRIDRVLRRIFAGEAFWAAEARGAKFKTPLEYLTSTARVLELTPDGSTRLAHTLKLLGQPLMKYPVPTGYPMNADAWNAPGQLLPRLRFAFRLGSGATVGLKPRLTGEDVLAPGELRSVAETLFVGEVPEDLWLRSEALVGLEQGPAVTRAEAVALYLASPEFQTK